jgi:hypothetical protein
MATTTEPRVLDPLGPQIIIPSPRRAAVPQPLGWASIFAATVISVGIGIVLHLFGIGVGLTALDPDNPSSLQSMGLGTGIWSIVAPIIALFIGGLVAGRTAPTLNSWNAAIHGAAMWALSVIISLITIMMVLGAVARGATSAAGSIVGAASETVSAAGEHASMLGLDAQDLVARLNRELAAKGMPPVEAKDVEAALREAVQVSVREGNIDRDRLVEITAKHTRLSRDQAEQLASDIESQLRAAKTQTGEALGRVQKTGLQALETTGKVLLGLSICLVLGLGAAMGGALITVRRERRDQPIRTVGA